MQTQPLLARTAQHTYLIRRADLLTIRTVAPQIPLVIDDSLRRTCTLAELGPLLDPADHSTQLRRRALVVPFRRRLVGLLVDAVDELDLDVLVVPLPDLLRTQLLQPWVCGAAIVGETLVAQLDLRAIGLSCLAAPQPAREPLPNNSSAVLLAQ